jgi:prophage regulatory protein
MSEHRILRLTQVKEKTGLGRSSIYAFEAAGKFPRRIKLGGHSVGWIAQEVNAWLEERIADSRPANDAATENPHA